MVVVFTVASASAATVVSRPAGATPAQRCVCS
jgi:hypothetical protein